MADGRLKIGSDFLKVGDLYLRIGPEPPAVEDVYITSNAGIGVVTRIMPIGNGFGDFINYASGGQTADVASRSFGIIPAGALLVMAVGGGNSAAPAPGAPSLAGGALTWTLAGFQAAAIGGKLGQGLSVFTAPVVSDLDLSTPDVPSITNTISNMSNHGTLFVMRLGGSVVQAVTSLVTGTNAPSFTFGAFANSGNIALVIAMRVGTASTDDSGLTPNEYIATHHAGFPSNLAHEHPDGFFHIGDDILTSTYSRSFSDDWAFVGLEIGTP